MRKVTIYGARDNNSQRSLIASYLPALFKSLARLVLLPSHPQTAQERQDKHYNLSKVTEVVADHIFEPRAKICSLNQRAALLPVRKQSRDRKANVFFPYKFALSTICSFFWPLFFICKFQQSIFQGVMETHYLNVFVVPWKKGSINITQPFKNI